MFFLSFQFFSQSEYRHLNKVMTNLTLDYLVRMGLNIAEDKLQKGRWYGDTTSRGTYEVPVVPVPGAKISIYADDYCRKEWTKIGKLEYAMLDHIKVFVEATYKGFKMYGYGKFIMSPEPILGGPSTKGVDITRNSTGTCPLTFRKMIHTRLLREVKVITEVPGFKVLSDFASRKALAAYLKKELFRYAENNTRNIQFSRNIMQNLRISNPTIDHASLLGILKGFDPAPPPKSENWMKNFFILENLKKFSMDTNWDAMDSGNPSDLFSVKIVLDTFSSKTPPDADVINAIRIVFGEGHPKVLTEGKDFMKEFLSSGQKSAIEDYLDKRGISGLMEKDPRTLQDEMSKVNTRYSYKFKWKATGVISGPGVDPAEAGSGKGDVVEGGASAFCFYWGKKGDPAFFLPGGKVIIDSKDGPTPTFSNYFLEKGARKLPLAFAFNIFMKYVDENAVYTPDSPIKDDSQVVTPPAPPGPPGPIKKEWDDISF